ncbi:MAG: guanylate kinase [Deltaproteobacteria bacterium RBG_19FT_COMBO_52_11]|nr:MAG: guanylate kinase [Deltaproteobacteria bacterium RBG_19FT_COMBO_52_11]
MGKIKKGLLFVVSAPSGTGKTTLCRAMVRIFPELHYSISYTTRPPRPGDADGRDYHFVSPEGFQEMIDRDEFAEWAEIYGYRYGTSRSLLERFSREGRDVILDLDGQGARQMRNKDLQGIFIFLLPPSWAELKRRLARRQTEGPKALKERLRMAKVEMAEARWYDYVIINDEIKKAEEQLQAIILSEHCRRVRMAEALEEMLQGK